MAATDDKYGTIVTELKDIPDGEPVFLIRAQDQLSITTLLAYRTFANFTGAPPEFLNRIQEKIDQFTNWQEDNYTKRPD